MQLTDTKLFRQQGYIDGAWAPADSGKTLAVTDPATGEQLGTVPNMGADETRAFTCSIPQGHPRICANWSVARSARN